MRANGPEEVRLAWEAADAAERAGDLDRAIAELVTVVALGSAPAKCYHRLGQLRERKRDWVGAVAAFAAAADLEPTRATRHYRLGQARELMWDLRGACDAYAEAVLRAPHRGQWLRWLERARAECSSFRPFQGKLIAHRGRVSSDVENALDSVGQLPPQVAGVEVDVRLTRDGVAVLMHDRGLERTTGRQGVVSELSYAELSSVSGARLARIPTLAEYLHACRGTDLQILVDIKAPTRAAFKVVASVIRDSTLAAASVAMVRDEVQLKELREVADDLRLGCFRTNAANVEQRIAAAQVYGAELLLVDHGDQRYLRNRHVIDMIQAVGLRAGASTINTRSALEAARTDGCDILITDAGEQLGPFAGHAGRAC